MAPAERLPPELLHEIVLLNDDASEHMSSGVIGPMSSVYLVRMFGASAEEMEAPYRLETRRPKRTARSIWLVSRGWHAFVNSSPRLWLSRLDIDIYASGGICNAASSISGRSKYFQDCDIDLIVRGGLSYVPFSIAEVEALAGILRLTATQWRRVIISLSVPALFSPCWERFQEGRPSFPRLKELSITSNSEHDFEMKSPSMAPNLKELALTGISFPNYPFLPSLETLFILFTKPTISKLATTIRDVIHTAPELRRIQIVTSPGAGSTDNFSDIEASAVQPSPRPPVSAHRLKVLVRGASPYLFAAVKTLSNVAFVSALELEPANAHQRYHQEHLTSLPFPTILQSLDLMKLTLKHFQPEVFTSWVEPVNWDHLEILDLTLYGLPVYKESAIKFPRLRLLSLTIFRLATVCPSQLLNRLHAPVLHTMHLCFSAFATPKTNVTNLPQGNFPSLRKIKFSNISQMRSYEIMQVIRDWEIPSIQTLDLSSIAAFDTKTTMVALADELSPTLVNVRELAVRLPPKRNYLLAFAGSMVHLKRFRIHVPEYTMPLKDMFTALSTKSKHGDFLLPNLKILELSWLMRERDKNEAKNRFKMFLRFAKGRDAAGYRLAALLVAQPTRYSQEQVNELRQYVDNVVTGNSILYEEF